MTGLLSWSEVQKKTTGTAPLATPCARSGHTLDAIDGRLVLYGGVSSAQVHLDDVWIFNPETTLWQSCEFASPPPGRAYHASCTIGSRLYFFGGLKQKLCNDLLVLDLVEKPRFTSLEIKAKGAPPALIAAQMCATSHAIFLFGGFDGLRRHNTMYHLDLNAETLAWQVIAPAGPECPSPRSHHVMEVVNHSIIVHGGYDGQNALRDTWMFQTATATWKLLVNTEPKMFHCGVARGPSLLLFAGCDDDECSNSLILLETKGMNTAAAGLTESMRADTSVQSLGANQRELDAVAEQKRIIFQELTEREAALKTTEKKLDDILARRREIEQTIRQRAAQQRNQTQHTIKMLQDKISEAEDMIRLRSKRIGPIEAKLHDIRKELDEIIPSRPPPPKDAAGVDLSDVLKQAFASKLSLCPHVAYCQDRVVKWGAEKEFATYRVLYVSQNVDSQIFVCAVHSLELARQGIAYVHSIQATPYCYGSDPLSMLLETYFEFCEAVGLSRVIVFNHGQRIFYGVEDVISDKSTREMAHDMSASHGWEMRVHVNKFPLSASKSTSRTSTPRRSVSVSIESSQKKLKKRPDSTSLAALTHIQEFPMPPSLEIVFPKAGLSSKTCSAMKQLTGSSENLYDITARVNSIAGHTSIAHSSFFSFASEVRAIQISPVFSQFFTEYKDGECPVQ